MSYEAHIKRIHDVFVARKILLGADEFARDYKPDCDVSKWVKLWRQPQRSHMAIVDAWDYRSICNKGRESGDNLESLPKCYCAVECIRGAEIFGGWAMLRLLGGSSDSVKGYLCVRKRIVEVQFDHCIIFFALEFSRLYLLADQLALQSKSTTIVIEFENPFHIKQLADLVADGLGFGDSVSLSSVASLTNDE